MSRGQVCAVAALVAGIVFLVPATAEAYVGPGAGIAVATTAFALLVSFLAIVLGLVLWPIRMVWRLVTRKRPPNKPAIRRAVIVGLDGLDPGVVRELMADGQLPNLERLGASGTHSDLGTTFPAMSPVAWSSFATGVDPGKHGIYDFLTRDRATYAPDLSSTDIRPPSRHLSLGRFRLPIGKPRLALLRRSKPFWKLLGRYRIPCSVLRVPITFPAEKFEGTMLSAMCVPDLQGSQGTFSYYSTDPDDARSGIGGRFVQVAADDGGVIELALEGPPNPIRSDGAVAEASFSLTVDREAGTAALALGRERVELRVGAYSDWLPVSFKLGLGIKLRGICRFRLLAVEPHLKLYVTPINIDPENPILPISHPRFFSIFLSKLIGRYATLGLAEDTWALNEGVLDEEAFLEQAWANHAEREAMFFEMLERTPRGLITCVFDGSDRIQHMFMRYRDDGHPALAATAGEGDLERYRDVIPETYRRLDAMVGRVLDEVDPDDPQNLVAVISDHGFQTFRRGVNLNAWLVREGYLVMKEGSDGSGEWFEGVDWSRSRAFALGLGGIFLNIKGRESQGVVDPAEAESLADEIAARLSGLRDDEVDAVAIREVYPAHSLFSGPYTEDAPDLVVGYAAGWRASWDGVRGISGGAVFSDNTKAWSGDHCIDPELVPGVLVCNRQLGNGKRPRIADLAPTILELFGVPAPRYMDGESLLPSGAGGGP
jgi:predicted AlkP superfamily phosphohydrolase/phosphomutase